jgi:ADP-ribose pyrophosphatase YjhB (NUDIX family)
MVAIEPRFCHQCGAELVERQHDGRPRRYCEGCERFFFRNAVPGVDVFVRHDGEFLLLREPGEGGRWVIPGGHPEYDEEPVDAAVRELKEETGLSADPADLSILTAIHSTYRGLHYNNICYLLEFDDTDGELTPGTEAAELRFWTPAEIRDSEQTRDIDRERLPLVTDD